MLSLAEALAALPDTADGIAAHLTAKGIRGVRKDGCLCPVANYLTSQGLRLGRVDGGYIFAVDPGGARTYWGTPVGIAEFIERFDRGAWPELVSEPEDDDA